MTYLVGVVALYLLMGLLLFLLGKDSLKETDRKTKGVLALLIMVFWLPLLILSLTNKLPPSDALR